MGILSPQQRADKLIAYMRKEKHTFKSLASRVKKPDGSHPTGEGLAKMIRRGSAPQTVLIDIARVLRIPSDEAAEIILGIKQTNRTPTIESAIENLTHAIKQEIRGAS